MIEVFRAFIKIVLKIVFRVEVIGKENVPKTGAALLCANHVGAIDMVFIGYKIKRLVHYMAKEELFKNKLASIFITWLGAFPVKRGKADVHAIKTAFRLLDEGHIVGIFAEGTRKKNRENAKVKINPGAAMFAIKKAVPVLPVAIEGNYKLFGKVRVVFGEPYYVNAEKDKKYTNDELIEISESIMTKVYKLLEGE